MNATTATAPAAIDAAISELTKLGRSLMTRIGQQRFSFFDDGVVEGSGIWGDNLGGEFGETKNVGGVVGRLVKAGLLLSQETGEPGGSWVTLTALGAEVAKALAAPAVEVEAPAVEVEAKPAKAKASKIVNTGTPVDGAKTAKAKAAKADPAKSTEVAAARDAAAAARVAALPEERRAQILAATPAGYAVIWPMASWSTLKATADAPADAARWMILCNAHGTTKAIPSSVSAVAEGKKDARPTWCPACAKAAKASAKK